MKQWQATDAAPFPATVCRTARRAVERASQKAAPTARRCRYHNTRGQQTVSSTARSHDPIDKRLRERLRRQQIEHCYICNGARGPIRYDLDHLDPLAFAVDHVIPLSRGGQKIAGNCRATHRVCNRLKSDSMPGDTPATPRPSKARTTSPATPRSSCPPGPCRTCRGTHDPHTGITFETARRWTP